MTLANGGASSASNASGADCGAGCGVEANWENWKNWKKNAALFLFGQGVSLFGSSLVQYAIMWHITLETKSGSMMTVFIVLGLRPTFFISPLGGVWADRFNRKYLINVADGVIAAATLFVAALFFLGFEGIWPLMACSAIRALGQGVQVPAVNSFVPQIVPEKHLSRVNGIKGGIESFTMLIAPMTSGALLSFASIKAIFFIDVITAAIGISIVAFWVKAPARARAEKTASGTSGYFHDLMDGMRYVVAHRYILQLVIFSTVCFAAFSPMAFLTPLQITRNYGGDVWRLTAIEMAFCSGMLLGGLLMSLWDGFGNRVYSMAAATFLFGVEIIGLGLPVGFRTYLGLMAACGLTMPLYNTQFMTMLQSRVEPEYMGRILGVFSMVTSVTMPVGMLVFGPLANLVSIEALLVCTGTVVLLLSVPLAASKSLREAGKT
jgi:DHA3 family macrolide efflux protein-like MFS transporter